MPLHGSLGRLLPWVSGVGAARRRRQYAGPRAPLSPQAHQAAHVKLCQAHAEAGKGGRPLLGSCWKLACRASLRGFTRRENTPGGVLGSAAGSVRKALLLLLASLGPPAQAILVSNLVASYCAPEGVYESELERDGTVYYLRPVRSSPLLMPCLRARGAACMGIACLLAPAPKGPPLLRIPAALSGPDLAAAACA